MTVKLFRQLILLSIVTAIISVMLSILLEPYLPGELRVYLENQSEKDVTNFDALLAFFAISIIIQSIIATIGLYKLKKKYRTQILWITVISFVLCPLAGPTVSSGWSDMFMIISEMLWGAVLAVSYCSPIKEEFEKIVTI